ncbi:proto-oncogene Mas-like [Leptodactylus fuscus]
MSINSTIPEWTHNLTQGQKTPGTTYLSLGYASIIICLIGIVGNLFMIWLFTLKLKKNYCTIYFLNLAVADLLFLLGFAVSTAYMLCLLGNVPNSYLNNQIIGLLSETLTNLGFDSSTFLLTVVSAERCLTVLCPLYNHLQRPRHQTTIICVLVWSLAILTMALEVYVCDDSGDSLSPGAQQCVPIIIFTTILFLVVLLLMVMSSVILLVEIQKTSQSCRPRRLYIIILLTLLSFFIEMVPSRILSLLIYFRVVGYSSNALVFHFIMSICTAVYCASNPYLNVFVGRWRERTSIRKSMEKMFQVNS